MSLPSSLLLITYGAKALTKHGEKQLTQKIMSNSTSATATATTRLFTSSTSHLLSSVTTNASDNNTSTTIDPSSTMKKKNTTKNNPRASNTNNNNTNNTTKYVSPLAPFFETISQNKITGGFIDTNDYSSVPETMLRCGIPESNLRFKAQHVGRSITPHDHVLPHEHRIEMICKMEDLPPLNALEKEIFLQIVGPRFNRKKNQLRLISNHFASRIENKRHVVSQFERIIESSKKLAEQVVAGKQ